MSHKRKHSFLNGQPAFKESVLSSQWNCFLRPLHEVIHTNSCHPHFSATCKVHSQSAFSDNPKKYNAAHFVLLVNAVMVPDIKGNYQCVTETTSYSPKNLRFVRMSRFCCQSKIIDHICKRTHTFVDQRLVGAPVQTIDES